MSNNVRQARLRWTGEGLAFRGGPEGATEIGVDSTGEIGPALARRLSTFSHPFKIKSRRRTTPVADTVL